MDESKYDIETSPDGRCRLTIKYFTEADQGFYKCVAMNELGSADTNARISLDSKDCS